MFDSPMAQALPLSLSYILTLKEDCLRTSNNAPVPMKTSGRSFCAGGRLTLLKVQGSAVQRLDVCFFPNRQLSDQAQYGCAAFPTIKELKPCQESCS